MNSSVSNYETHLTYFVYSELKTIYSRTELNTPNISTFEDNLFHLC